MTVTKADREEFLAKLGSEPKGNKALIEELGWEDARYRNVKEELLKNGSIEKRKGQGGSVIKIQDANEDEKSKEKDVYEPIRKELEEMWKLNNEIENDKIESKITAFQGKRNTGGKWSRPDITIITFKKYDYILLPVLEVVTFELKTDLSEMNLASVYEAVAQQRSAHKSYVVFVSHNSPKKAIDPYAAAISEECGKLGIGLIVTDHLSDHKTWEIVLDAERNEPNPERLNSFISTQIGDEIGMKIKEWYQNWQQNTL